MCTLYFIYININYVTYLETIEQTASVKCFSKSFESYTKVKPFVTSENTIKYGPYKNMKPFSFVSNHFIT